MVLVEAICEHVVHEEVELIDTIKLLNLRIELVSTHSCEILVASIPNVRILVNVIKGPLLPPILDVPIQLPVGPLLNLPLILSIIMGMLAKLLL